MAETNTKSKTDDSQFRKIALKYYIEKKKADPSYIAQREEVVNGSKVPRRAIYRIFGSFHNFVKEAEAEYIRSLPTSARALLSERSKKFCVNATKDECIEDLRQLQKRNPLKHITRNFYRDSGTFSDATWNQFFGTFQEFRRCAGLELSRTQHKLEREIAKHASADHYSKYYETHVAPFYRKFEKVHQSSKLKRIMVISDIHDIECEEFTLEVFIAECKRKQPDIIVLNGDIFDLYEFSRYTQDPRHIKIKERFEFIHKRVFKALRDACPDAQIDFIMGNHEFRLIKYLADATPNLRILLSDVMGITFSKVFGLDEFQINWVSKFDLTAFTKTDIANIMKQNHKIYFDTFCVSHEPDAVLQKSYTGTNGHHHSASLESGFNMHTGVTSWTQTPAAHVRDAEYLYKVSKWNTGFLEAVINTEQRQAIQRIHHTHNDWCEIDGVLYERKERYERKEI